jgi:hypothetical protein
MKRSRLHRGSGSAKKDRLKHVHVGGSPDSVKVKEIMDFQGGILQSWDIRELQNKAIYQRFNEADNVYLGRHYRESNENFPIQREYDRIKGEIVKDFGSIDEYRRVREYYGAKSWSDFGSVSGDKIKGRSYSTVFVTLPVDSVYNFSYMVLKGEHLRDYKRVHDMFTEQQKQQYYSPDGTIRTDLFTMKRYKNGNVDITFNNEADANKVFHEWKRLEGVYRQKRDKIDE